MTAYLFAVGLLGFNLLLPVSDAWAHDGGQRERLGGGFVSAEGLNNIQPTPEAAIDLETASVPRRDAVTMVQQYDDMVQAEVVNIESSLGTCDDGGGCLGDQPSAARPVVKNKDFFGVGDASCRDQWASFCKFKDLKIECGCAGSMAARKPFAFLSGRKSDTGESSKRCKGDCCKLEKKGRREKCESCKSPFSSAWNKSSSKSGGQ